MNHDPFPDTPAGHQAAWWYSAVSRLPLPDHEIESRFAPELSHQNLFVGRMPSTFGYQHGHLVRSSSHCLVIERDGPIGSRVRLTIEVTTQAPHRICRLEERPELPYQASVTAVQAAAYRAHHGVVDPPPMIFDDGVASSLLGPMMDSCRRSFEVMPGVVLGGERAMLLSRSRYTEDALAAAYADGLRQYVILGAGFDTFALRASPPLADLRVFEVDSPGSQRYKRQQITAAGLIPARDVTWVPLDFETRALAEALPAAGLSLDEPIFVSMLGVSYYLTLTALRSTLAAVAAWPRAHLVFDYLLPPDRWNTQERQLFGPSLRRAYEPLSLFATEDQIARELAEAGFTSSSQLGRDEITERYLSGREDSLWQPVCFRLAHAVT